MALIDTQKLARFLDNLKKLFATKDELAEGFVKHSDLPVVKGTGNYSVRIPIDANQDNNGTVASGAASVSLGDQTVASGDNALAEGERTEASGYDSHAEGYLSKASGSRSHAEGNYTNAVGNGSHSEGENTTANGMNSHVEGNGSQTGADAYGAHAEGYYTKANSAYSHAEGYNTTAGSRGAHAEGSGASVGNNAEGAHAEGIGKANAQYAHAEGAGQANAINSHAEGLYAVVLASGQGAHAEGTSTAEGIISHAEGNKTKAVGLYSHSEGNETTASGVESHAEGVKTTASGKHSHAEGYLTVAAGEASHAEGGPNNQANGMFSHAEGQGNTVAESASIAHAEGYGNVANGALSHVEGGNNIAENTYEHAQGCYNKSNKADNVDNSTIHSVGCGNGPDARKNAHEILKNGENYMLGIGGYDGTNPYESKSLREVIDKLEEAYSPIPEEIAEQAYVIEAILAKEDKFGKAQGNRVDAREYSVYGYPDTLLAHGTPSADVRPINLPDDLPWDGIPSHMGQKYINLDAASGGFYYSVGFSSIGDWRQQ